MRLNFLIPCAALLFALMPACTSVMDGEGAGACTTDDECAGWMRCDAEFGVCIRDVDVILCEQAPDHDPCGVGATCTYDGSVGRSY